MDQLDFETISTKSFASFLKRFEMERTLIVTDDFSNNLHLSARNVPLVKLLKADSLNVHDLLKYKNLFITKAALQSVEGAFQP